MEQLKRQYEIELYELNKYDNRNKEPLPLQIHHFRNRWIKRINKMKLKYELLRAEQREMQEASEREKNYDSNNEE